MFNSGEEVATFGYVVGVSLTRKFKLTFWRFLNWSAKESRTLSLSDQSL